jgi:hypothetical protein
LERSQQVKNGVKVRALLRVLGSIGEAETAMVDDLHTYYAPSECYANAYSAHEEWAKRRIKRASDQLDFPVGVAALYLRRWATLEEGAPGYVNSIPENIHAAWILEEYSSGSN